MGKFSNSINSNRAALSLHWVQDTKTRSHSAKHQVPKRDSRNKDINNTWEGYILFPDNRHEQNELVFDTLKKKVSTVLFARSNGLRERDEEMSFEALDNKLRI